MLTQANGITYRQMATPDALQSRVNVIGRMVAWAASRSELRSAASSRRRPPYAQRWFGASVLLLVTGVVTGVVLWNSGDDG